MNICVLAHVMIIILVMIMIIIRIRIIIIISRDIGTNSGDWYSGGSVGKFPEGK